MTSETVETIKSLLPMELQRIVKGATWQEIRVGESGTYVFKLTANGLITRYLKVRTNDTFRELEAEAARLEWLQGKLPIPTLLYFGAVQDTQFLLITRISGIDTSQPEIIRHPDRLVRVLAEGLRLIHSVDWSSCPFNRRIDIMIAAAKQRVDADQVDVYDFDIARRGRSKESLYQELVSTRPPIEDEDPVFVHGDYCLPNILVNVQDLSLGGFIDWGRAGVADRYQDLALAERSIIRNLGQEWIRPFFIAYGVDQINRDKIQFYQLLDEFF